MTTNKKLDLKNKYNIWFDSPYYHILYENRDYKEAEKFIKTIVKYIELEKNSTILDAACGKGRHSIEMEKLGFKVLGIDLSKNSIKEAKKYENKNLKFLIHDISVPIKREFDAVFNLFTSFGYHNKKKDLIILKSIEKNLKNKGIGVIDFFNVNKVKNELVKSEIIVKKNIKFNIERKINKGYVRQNIKFSNKSREYNFTENVNTLSLKDFKHYFNKTNFKIKEVFGSYSLDKFDPKYSPRLIIIFQKKSQPNK